MIVSVPSRGIVSSNADLALALNVGDIQVSVPSRGIVSSNVDISIFSEDKKQVSVPSRGIVSSNKAIDAADNGLGESFRPLAGNC